ncbi:alpha-glucosidase [Paenibacillus sp. UNCCL117]|uniref:glycoside hydrolase family 97 protein n=1 Tax=unclassified Paenibacillus TaxID=185978 RepID=UPI00088BC95D|nr:MULTISPECIES: glycoside hydrolase family 97 protein [unclassified Paenibacillus]SDC90631.1 alpha-glucosidase [Paenibacillus sp. cl123]SFW28894.1 alpha-glucosidase [Paenibacillus sp. UNCCL117]
MINPSVPLSRYQLQSPKGAVSGDLIVSAKGQLQYEVKFRGTVVVDLSDLGILVDAHHLGDGVEAEAPVYSDVDETYPARGVHTMAVNRCREMRIAVTHKGSGIPYTIEARAYEDGFAVRYVLPDRGMVTIRGEASSWKLPAQANIWFFERNNGWKLKSYAGEWVRTGAEKLHTVSSQGPVQGTPLVVELPGDRGYAVICEAALYNYSGMRLAAMGDGIVKADFTEGTEGFRLSGEVVTPWRVTLLSPDLNGLVNSDLLTNLNPEPDAALFEDQSYIRPGRSVWRWWSRGTGSFEEEKAMIDHAEALGYEYTTVDEGWELWENKWAALKELTGYASSKGVGVFVWKRSKEMNDPAERYRAMREFMDHVKEAGAVGLKIDFIDCEDLVSIAFETAALRIAAERRLMVNFHGISKPTGESRTYPNEISREGIRGLELNKMKEGPIPAWHNAALPFTRFLAGHGDYTPMGFSNPGDTTFAHQLATGILFTSPLQVIAEHPEYLLQEPSCRPALDIIKELPTVWDETVVLKESRIGELAAMARRKGDVWYVAVLNGTAEAVALELEELPFLTAGKSCRTVMLSDAGCAAFTREEAVYSSSQLRLQIQMPPHGGYIAVLRPADEVTP